MERQSIGLLREMLKCGTNISLWHYDAEGHLLDTDCEHTVLDKIFSFVGCNAYMLEHGTGNRKPLMLSSDMGLMWCAVYGSENAQISDIYVMGPVLNAQIPDAFLTEYIKRNRIDLSFRSQFFRVMKDISVVPSLMFQQYCLMLHYCINGERLNRSDIHYQPRNKQMLAFPSDMAPGMFERTSAYQAERDLLDMIRKGDPGDKKTLEMADHLFDPVFVRERGTLRKAVADAVGFATLCIRAAIDGGISVDTAFSVGEGYMESMLQCRSESELVSLNITMFEDFVFRVRKHGIDLSVSPQIRCCRDHIELHLEEDLRLSELAKKVGYSEFYLSRKFKSEMGVSISAYIKQAKVERAKMMLVTTALPIGQIANSLRFSSSSHFSENFRMLTGKTPQQYRAENLRL